MRASVVTLALVACSTPPAPEVAFVVERSDELPALHSATTGVPAVGFASLDAATQRAHVERAIELGVRVIVLEPVDGSDPDLVTLAHERGVRVVAYGREPERRLDGDTVDALVAFDGYRAGALQAAAAVDTLGRGRIAIVDTPDDATGVAGEIARGYALTLAPYIARGDITLVDDVAAADAILATTGTGVRSLRARPAFVASAGGDNTDLVCAGQQQLDVRLDRADLATAAGTIVRRLVAGEDIGRDPQMSRLPNRRLPVELARVSPFTASDCAALRHRT